MIEICYAEFPATKSTDILDEISHVLPDNIQKEASLLLKPEDRQNFLLGRFMLKSMTGKDLDQIRRNIFGRPYLPGTHHFSISYSGRMVICAVAENQRVGIDIERIRKIDVKEYNSVLNPQDLNYISQSGDELAAFFRVWTSKESLMKADGRGFMIDMDQITFHHGEGMIHGESRRWKLRSFNTLPGYEIALCSEKDDNEISFREFDPVFINLTM